MARDSWYVCLGTQPQNNGGSARRRTVLLGLDVVQGPWLNRLVQFISVDLVRLLRGRLVYGEPALREAGRRKASGFLINLRAGCLWFSALLVNEVGLADFKVLFIVSSDSRLVVNSD